MAAERIKIAKKMFMISAYMHSQTLTLQRKGSFATTLFIHSMESDFRYRNMAQRDDKTMAYSVLPLFEKDPGKLAFILVE